MEKPQETQEQNKTVAGEIAELYNQDTIDSLLRAIELTEGITDNDTLKRRLKGEAVTKAVLKLETEGTPESKQLATDLEVQYKTEYGDFKEETA